MFDPFSFFFNFFISFFAFFIIFLALLISFFAFFDLPFLAMANLLCFLPGRKPMATSFTAEPVRQSPYQHYMKRARNIGGAYRVME